MTVPSTINTFSYAGDGITTVFPYPCYFLSEADLRVILRQGGFDTAQAINTHYSVSGAGIPAGGAVAFVAPPAVGQTVVISRDPPITQETDYVPNDPFPAESHERALDKAAMIDQALRRDIDGAVRGAYGEALQRLPPAAARALKYPFFDASGQPTLIDAGLGELVFSLGSFPDRAALANAEIATAITKVVFVGGYASYGDGGHGWYRHMPGGSTWTDGEVVDQLGQVWQLMLTNGCLYAAQLGVVADGNLVGNIGTDNSAAISRIIAAPADIVIWPSGGIRFLNPQYPRASQFWVSEIADVGPNNIDEESRPSGNCFVYAGSGHRAAFEGNPLGIWSNNYWSGIGVRTGSGQGVEGINGTDCEWLFYGYHCRGTRWDKCRWRHGGGVQGNVPAESVEGSFGCLRLDGKLSGATWYHEFRENEFLSGASREDGPLGGADTANYQGYAWAFDIEGNDIHASDCHFNNTSVRGRLGGGMKISGCNFENGDWGSEPGFGNPATGRAAIVATNQANNKGATGDKPGAIGLTIDSSSRIGQYTYAIVIDASYHAGTSECGLRCDGNGFRRNRDGEVLLIQNVNGTCGGGSILGCANTTRDEDEIEDVDSPGIGKAAPIRLIVRASDKTTPARWPGLRVSSNNTLYPEVWDDQRGITAGWWPRHNATALDTRGAAPKAIADYPAEPNPGWTNMTAAGGVLTGASFHAGWPFLTRSSVDKAAEFHTEEYVCAAGASMNFGGYMNAFVWSCPTVVAGSDRGFVGLRNATGAIGETAQPSSLAQMCGVGFDSTDPRHWHFIIGDVTGENQHIDLGSDFPVDTTTAVYALRIWTEGALEKLMLELTRVDAAGPRVYQSFSASQGPGAGQPLVPHFWRSAAPSGTVAMRVYLWECRAQPFDWLGSRLRSVR
jgi:hypothetical protein